MPGSPVDVGEGVIESKRSVRRQGPTFALGDVALHAVDFWLSTEDLPQPENRVTLNADGNIVLSYTPNNTKPLDELLFQYTVIYGPHPAHRY